MAKVTVYSKEFCPYCVRAKDLLTRKGVPFEEINLEDDPDGFTALKKRTGMMTVPQIFINDQLVGGFQELSTLERENKLDQLLKA